MNAEEKRQYHKLKSRESYLRNREKVLLKSRERYDANRESIIARQIAYGKTEHGKMLKRKASAEWRAKNPEKYLAYARKGRENRIANGKHEASKAIYWENRKRNNYEGRLANARAFHHRLMRKPEGVLMKRLRGRLADAIRWRGSEAKKAASTTELVGCSRAELVSHIESKFKQGMTWENRNQWHIDHIRPVCSFDLLDPEQQRKCFHFTNLQPLWKWENIRKGTKYTPAEASA